MSYLAVNDLTIEFRTPTGALRAVDRLSFAVERERTLGIVGESGCGKTAAAYAVTGLHDPRRTSVTGEVLLDGQQVTGLDDRRMRAVRGRQVGMVFQDPTMSLHPFYPVGRQVAEAYRAHTTASRSAARQRAIDYLDLVGIPEAARRFHAYPHELSGGMRQRVMIAMAVICEPALLIADEPTTALDVTVQAQILALLQQLQDELGMAIVYISHDLAVVRQIADQVLVMYAGRCVELGPTSAVLHDPRHPYTRGLLNSTPRLTDDRDSPLAPIPGSPPSPAERPAGCAFRPRCPYADIVGSRAAEEQPELRLVPGTTDHRVACHLEHVAW